VVFEGKFVSLFSEALHVACFHDITVINHKWYANRCTQKCD